MSWLKDLFPKPEPAKLLTPAKTAPATTPADPFAGIPPEIRFGHYSDNNKSYRKMQRWYEAEDFFRDKNYQKALTAIFDYIADDAAHNLTFTAEGDCFEFLLYQGAKKITGHCDGKNITAQACLAEMNKPSVPVMRRLLELNYHLFYTRAALTGQGTLCMMFESDLPSANPLKVYHGLRELATKADKQDDQLSTDFPQLPLIRNGQMTPLPPKELDVKFSFFKKWISETLAYTATLNADAFAGAIAYCYLVLAYRIDFLIVPSAGLLTLVEQISRIYWDNKDQDTLVRRNDRMREAVLKLQEITKEAFAASVYHSKSTFALAGPPDNDKIKSNYQNANKDSDWYIRNKYDQLAQTINEYGVSYNQFAYSMPQLLTRLATIYYAAHQPEYFKALGLTQGFYNPESGQFNQTLIVSAVDAALKDYEDKYPKLHWNHEAIQYDNWYNFGISFAAQMAQLNLELKR